MFIRKVSVFLHATFHTLDQWSIMPLARKNRAGEATALSFLLLQTIGQVVPLYIHQ